MNYLLDTNIISEIMRKAPDRRVCDWFAGLEDIYFCAITLEEVVYGLQKRGLLRKLAWFQQFSEQRATILHVSEGIAHWSGYKRAELARNGRQVTMADSLIAACAWEHGLILATRNTRDFEGFGIPVFDPFAT